MLQHAPGSNDPIKCSALADVCSQVACASVCVGGTGYLPCVTNMLLRLFLFARPLADGETEVHHPHFKTMGGDPEMFSL